MDKMKITIVGDPRFYLDIDLATVRALVKLSQAHYDFDCRAAGRVGGFLYGWLNLMLATLDQEVQPSKVSGTFRELDLTMKLIEMASLVLCTDERVLVKNYQHYVHQALKRANEITDWRLEL